MIIQSEQSELNGLRAVADLMCIAARTAPKARGWDLIRTAVIEGDEKRQLADEMRRLGREKDIAFFARDADNLDNSPCVVLIGTAMSPRGVKGCSYCGAADCAENAKGQNVCAMVVGDLGIALGSAAAVASYHHVDNRMMYSVGKAALSLGLLGDDVTMAHGFPLSASGKNIFFDRSPT